MKIFVNGKEREFADGKSVTEILAELGIKLDGSAVALNLEVVRKKIFDKTFLKEGDKVEIIRAVQGG